MPPPEPNSFTASARRVSEFGINGDSSSAQKQKVLLGDGCFETSLQRTLRLEFRKAWWHEILIKMCVNSSVGRILFLLNFWPSRADCSEESQPTAHALCAVSSEGAGANVFSEGLWPELISACVPVVSSAPSSKVPLTCQSHLSHCVMLLPSKQTVVCMWLASWAIKALKGEVVPEILCESSSSQITQLDGTRRLCSAQDSCCVLLLSFCTRLWRRQHRPLAQGWSTRCLSGRSVSCLVTIFYFLHVTEHNQDQMKQSSSGRCSAHAGLAGGLLELEGCWEVWVLQLTFSQLQRFGLSLPWAV